MRLLTLLLGVSWLGVAGCGAPRSSTLPGAEQKALCTPLAQQAAGDFACRESQLASSHANSGETLHFAGTVEFSERGKVAKIRDLKAVTALRETPRAVPDCVVGTLQRLRVAERTEPVRMSVALTYTRGATPGSQLRPDGTCTIIVPPLPQ